jgi:flagellar biosynthesis/type III secretory pathway M-ring protein FliF/YscJ
MRKSEAVYRRRIDNTIASTKGTNNVKAYKIKVHLPFNTKQQLNSLFYLDYKYTPNPI